MGLVEGFRVNDGGLKTAGLDWRIRLVLKGSSESGRETGVSARFCFPCRSLNGRLGIAKGVDTGHVRVIWL